MAVFKCSGSDLLQGTSAFQSPWHWQQHQQFSLIFLFFSFCLLQALTFPPSQHDAHPAEPQKDAEVPVSHRNSITGDRLQRLIDLQSLVTFLTPILEYLEVAS